MEPHPVDSAGQLFLLLFNFFLDIDYISSSDLSFINLTRLEADQFPYPLGNISQWTVVLLLYPEKLPFGSKTSAGGISASRRLLLTNSFFSYQL